MADSEAERIRVRDVQLLSDRHYVLRSTRFDYRRLDGSWQSLTRESYDHGDGAVVLPYDAARGTVLLVRQFRYPAYANGHPEPMIEAIAGLLDALDPLDAIVKEAQEEAGLRLRAPRRVYAAFMSPGALTERKREAARRQLGNVAAIWEEA